MHCSAPEWGLLHVSLHPHMIRRQETCLQLIALAEEPDCSLLVFHK
jgi:hypothetical protein